VNLAPFASFTSEQKRGLVLVAIVAVGLSLFYISLAHGHSLAPAQAASEKLIDPLVAPAASPTHSPPPSLPALVVVDVAGKVNHPGVYSLPAGSRAIDAIKSAGGAKSGVDLSDINLAEILFDGQQVLVGSMVTSSAMKPKSTHSSPVSHFPIHLNSATAVQLDQLPGIGPVMAERIVDYRKKNGAFAALEGLRKVKGMGAAKFEEIKSLLVL
jgi:competence protein ComEA